MIIKTLSANDTGETGAHQAGILVPKKEEILGFFPVLITTEKNPRAHINITDDSGMKWNFNFIYYNNKFFGGTRNEFRLTGMTKYIKSNNLKAGDKLVFSKSDDRYLISHKRTKDYKIKGALKLSDSWVTIKLK